MTGAASEPDLEAVLAEGQRRHTFGAASVVGLLRRLDALPADLDDDAATGTLAALSDVRVALMLHESYGWPLDRVETWIADASRALLLRGAAAGRTAAAHAQAGRRDPLSTPAPRDGARDGVSTGATDTPMARRSASTGMDRRARGTW